MRNLVDLEFQSIDIQEKTHAVRRRLFNRPSGNPDARDEKTRGCRRGDQVGPWSARCE